MAVDTPARIAILGAGPMGLEAALYARFLGYAVDIYERGRVAENVLRWGQVRMFTPFGKNRSTLALAAIQAHEENYSPPDDAVLLTGREWAERYLLPLAQTDLLSDHLHAGQAVVTIGREGIRKGDLAGHEDRDDYSFRLLLRTADGQESVQLADVVIDSTGTFGNPNWLGQGGVPAIGETALRAQIEYGVPDVLGAERNHYAARHTLVIGAGHSAATTVCTLTELAREVPETRVTWLIRKLLDLATAGPVPSVPNDPLPERARVVDRANEIATGLEKIGSLFSDTVVHAIQHDSTTDQFLVELRGEHAGEQRFDRIVANVGYRPDNQILSELHVRTCCVTDRALSPTAERFDLQSTDPQRLVTSEPHFYVLGSKSYGRRASFLFEDGLHQIRDLFTIIGDRPSLDLYAGPTKLPT